MHLFILGNDNLAYFLRYLQHSMVIGDDSPANLVAYMICVLIGAIGVSLLT